MFLLFQTPAFVCGENDAEMERALQPGWPDAWFNQWGVDFPDVARDPGHTEGRFEWRPQRFIDPAELEGY